MADIRTRQINKGTIKSLDKAASAADHMRVTYTKTKDRAESMRDSDYNSPVSYATDKTRNAAENGLSTSEKATGVKGQSKDERA